MVGEGTRGERERHFHKTAGDIGHRTACDIGHRTACDIGHRTAVDIEKYKGKVVYGQEPPSEESTTTECGSIINYLQ